MADGIAGFFEGIAALVELAFRVLVGVVRGAFTLIAYACSPDYRVRKEIEWTGRSFRKFLELSFSGVCLASLILFGVWALVGIGFSGQKSTAAAAGNTNRVGELKFTMQGTVQTTGRDGTNRTFELAADNAGLGRIAAAQDLNDLVNRVRENVKVVEVRTNSATNHSVKFQFSIGGRK